MPGLRRRRPAANAATPATKRSHSPASARVKPAESGAATGVGNRAEQLRLVWNATRARDPRMPLLVLGPAVALLIVLVVVGVVIGHPLYLSILGILGGVMLGMAIFGRRATAQMYSSVEGQIGAAASMLQSLRGDWRLTPAVGFTRNQDLVHRVAGRCGVVLVGEGPSLAAQRQLVTDQKRRINRVAPEVATHEVYIGDGEGQVPLRKMQSTIMKFPTTVKGKEITDLERRLKAIGGGSAPIPKGPMPRSARVPRAGR